MTFTQGSPDGRLAALRDELAPYVGERVVALLEAALSDPGAGDDADVTEAERLLLGWGRHRARGESLDGEESARFDRTFSPRLRELLDEFATIIMQ